MNMLSYEKSLDPKNLTIITHLFGHAKKGSLEFWSALNMRFQQVAEKELTIQDCT
jgi:hypothetical protein